MPSTLPIGLPAPADGLLPPSAAKQSANRLFGLYIHVPFCRVRCGYCDFNTYTSDELPGASRQDYPDQVRRELDFARRVLDDSTIPARQVTTVFFGGGTPTLLDAGAFGEFLDQIDSHWGLCEGAEVTVEANPDTLSQNSVSRLADAGVTRLSLGVQSFVPHVLETLDRTHDPAQVPQAVAWAHDAGLEVSVDLIYGTPGESVEDWRYSLARAVELQPDHISAYSLIVEPGTALARRIRRGELADIDDDSHAEFYEVADSVLEHAGYDWYEVSNWSRSVDTQCRHNLGYWRGHDWWGFGPGAHSHVGGVRWWNVKHPTAWANRVAEGVSPAAARELLDSSTQRFEAVMLGLRLRDGLPTSHFDHADEVVNRALESGWLDPQALESGRLVLTLSGRLMADGLAVALSED